ncbi:hypothetical protein O3G_MSEX004267 [Manduca sexta]|nr:hypothetical protein O3G_MSEX004267 [Manduca sexta]
MSQGCTKSSFTVDKSMCNGGFTLHGGYIASIVDVLSFYSILSHRNGKISWTTNLNVDYLKLAAVSQKVTVETKLQMNGNIPITQTSLFDESGTVLARGTASFKAGNEELQIMLKKLIGFDVYENEC